MPNILSANTIVPPAPSGQPQLSPRQDRRALDDPRSLRTRVYANVLKAAQSLPDTANQRHTLRLRDVQYVDPEDVSIAKQKEAILTGHTLGRRIKGTWELIDNATGNVLDRRAQTVARVPLITNRGTIIHNGNEYTVANQLRLRPGIYTRIKDNGLTESHVNLLRGASHRYFLDPAKGTFHAQIGQAKLPLMPLLRLLGAKDKDLQEAWGADIWSTNAQMDDPSVLNKYFARLAKHKARAAAAGEAVDKAQAIREAIAEMELDPDVTEHTLGKRFRNVSLESILETTKKLLAVSRGEAEVDDRDNLAYQTIYSPEDLFAERLTKDYGGARKNLLRRSSFRGDLAVVQPGALTKQLESVLLNSGLAGVAEEINAAELLDKQFRVSRLGEGGIPCYSADTEVYTDSGWKLWPDITAEDRLACIQEGRLTFAVPIKLYAEDYSGMILTCASPSVNYKVTPNHRLYVNILADDQFVGWEFVTAEQTHGKPAAHYTEETGTRTASLVGPQHYGQEQYEGKVYCAEVPGNLLFVRRCGKTLWCGNSIDSVPDSARSVQPSHFGFIDPSKSPECLSEDMDVYTKAGWKPWPEVTTNDEFACLVDGQLEFHKPQALVAAHYCGPMYGGKGAYISYLVTPNHRMYVKLQDEVGSHWGIKTPEEVAQGDYQFLGSQVISPTEQQLSSFVLRRNQYFTEHYDGMVYCAQVPGGLLHVRRGNMHGHWTGNSFRAGVDSQLTSAVQKGADGRLYSQFIDARTGRTVWRSPQELRKLTVAFPGELNRPTKRIGAMAGGKLKFVPRNQVDLILPSFEKAFSPLSNLIPMKSAMKAQRASMGSRMYSQALPLINPEAPLVQSGVPGENDYSYEQKYGTSMGAMRAEKPGTVVSVTQDAIKVRYADGTTEVKELYNNFPFNRKCVHGDSVINVLRRKDIIRTRVCDYEWREGDKIQSVSPETKKAAWLPITAFNKISNDKRLLTIKLKSGRSICVTEDHSLVTLGTDGELKPCYPKDCISGKTVLPVAALPAIEGLAKEKDPRRVKARPYYLKAVLYGMYAAGGIKAESSGKVSIAIETAEQTELVKLILQVCGFEAQTDAISVSFTDTGTAEDLLSTFGSLPAARRIPESVLQAGPGYRQAFICGYLSVAGVVTGDVMASGLLISAKSKQLLADLQDLLATFGVFSLQIKPPSEVSIRGLHWLRVIPEHIAKLNRWFFYEEQEAKRVQRCESRPRPASYEKLPIGSFAESAIVAGAKESLRQPVFTALKQGAISKSVLSDNTSVFGDWARSDVCWDTVKSVKPAGRQEFVYDLTVADSSVFCINQGVVVHNTLLTNYPMVQPGQQFAAGDLLAKSNYTDDTGTTAVGKNFRVAYIPFRGANFEDAIVISESAAKKLTSEHMYQHGVEWTEAHKKGKRHFIGLFPGAYDKETLAKMDDDGVILPGTEVQFGDPLILAASKREQAYGKIHKKRSAAYSNSTEKWEHHAPGIVTDVAKTPKGVAVVVKSLAEMQVGDKLSGRFGDKGVVSLIVPNDQMPRDANGQPAEILVNSLGVISRCYDESTEFLTDRGWVFGCDITAEHRFVCYHVWTQGLFVCEQLAPFHVADYSGRMWLFQNKVMDFCVTPNHRMWSACGYPGAPWQEVTADRIAGRKGWKVPVAGLPVPGQDEPFVLPHIEYHVKDTQSNRNEIAIEVGDWAEFLGWYIAEGNSDVKVHISQRLSAHPDNCRRIAELLRRLPFGWCYTEANSQFHISSKRLATYLKQFGLCRDKFIPDWVFSQSPAVRQRFLDGYLAGNGTHDRSHRAPEYNGAGTMSARLASDLQRLLIYQGYSANISCYTSGIWRVGIHSRRHRILEGRNWQEIDYDGRIYCPTVPTGYVVTRRNGKILIAGNTNPSQIFETVLGKIAAKTGKPYRIADFENIDDLAAFTLAEMKKHGIEDMEDLTDPETEQKIPGVLTGNRFFMKLVHTSESKSQGRGTGGYTMEGTPAKGGETGSKMLGLLAGNALLSHNATAVIRDAAAIRGQRNEEFWLPFLQGLPPAKPKVPLVYHKFVNELRAAGINVISDGPQLHIMAMTDKDIDKLAENREITNGETVQFEKGQRPVPGGLFDPKLTGMDGSRWSFLRLHEPMPNPVMEEPIRRILGLTQKQLEDIIAGKQELHGRTGPQAIQAALKTINVDKELEYAREQIKSGRKTARDVAVRKLGYLKSAQKLGIHPSEWMLTKVPVLPPKFRPVSVMSGNNMPLVTDANYLYKELMEANNNLREMSAASDDVSDERRAVYNSFKAVVGLGDPVHPKLKEKKVEGILKHVLGSSPKFGEVQRRLLGGTVDLVGRAVIIPDPDLDMDHVGLPEGRAWEVYSNFIKRRLRRRGMPLMEAAKHVQQRTELARQELLKEMEDRPVIVDRAPILHRFGIMAFYPKLVQGETLRVSPLIVKGAAADFDGDYGIDTVIVKLSNKARTWLKRTSGSLFLETHRMSYASNCSVPVQSGDNLFLFDLEEFPRGELLAENSGKAGNIDFYDMPPGVEVLAYNESTGAMEWAKVTSWSVHHDREVEIVDLRSGRQIYTDDDPRAVYGCGIDSLKPARFTPSEALAAKVLVPRAARLDIPDEGCCQAISTGGAEEEPAHTRSHLRDEIKPDKDFGYVLGVMAGDGWVSTSKGELTGQFHICGQDEDIFVRFDSALSCMFRGNKPAASRVEMRANEDNDRYGDVSRITYSSYTAAELFHELLGHRAKNKHLPPFFLSAPREFRSAMLAGLLDTDGTIAVSNAKAKNKPQLMCQFCSTSFRMIREVKLLAASLGINGRVTQFTYRGDRTGWTLYFTAADVQRWGADEMGCQRKKEKLFAVSVDSSSTAAASADVIPITAKLATFIATKLRPLSDKRIFSTYTLVKKAAGTNIISRLTAKRILEYVPEVSEELAEEFQLWKQIVANENVFWDPVVGVQKTGVIEQGYDLTVPGYETFMTADGVIASNTMCYSVPVSEDAKEEAKERMLPSANLIAPADFKSTMHNPANEYVGGLYAASAMRSKRPVRTFRSAKDVAAAFLRGELDVRDPVEVLT